MATDPSKQFPVVLLDELDRVVGGESQSPDPIAGLKRATEPKPGHGSLDVFGYAETNRQGIGVEARQHLTPNVSVFGQVRTGVKDNKPDNGVMGGIRFEW